MFHRTQRLLLRPAWPEDWEALFAGISDEGVVRNLARAPWPYRPDDAREFVGRGQDPRYPAFLLTRPGMAGSQVVGCAGLGCLDGEAELGYWIARPFWGQGFATEGARGVLEVARLLGHRRIVGGHYLDNPASGAVLRKLGFRRSGHVRPRECLARGVAVPCAEYALDLDDVVDAPLRAA